MVESVCIDGNEAAARVAHRLSEVVAIYPITPASPMGELADTWSSAGRTNLWGTVPEVIELQSEGGAAGALHGATQKGALATTFTASQGLLLMIPNLYKMAGELSPVVLHVAARSVATHALSIFGDHSDVMAARQTGCALLCASNVQEAHDLALVAHVATLRTRVPFIHFFDGFRTSHQIDKIALLDDDDLRALVREDDILEHRLRGLSPDRPVLRGSAQNPDVFFQAREAANPFHDAVPATVGEVMDELAARTGRAYRLVDYVGAPDAERVVVMMGSGVGSASEAVDALVARGEKVGLAVVRLYRPFPSEALLDALPTTVRSVAVLDRTKEPGAVADPLCADVTTTLARTAFESGAMPRVVGGRYGLSSKEFTPAMAKAVFDELEADEPRPTFTVGIRDDVTGLSLDVDDSFAPPTTAVEAVFWGLGSDGTVGANKSAIKIIGEHTDLWAQGYFVYDSRKAGAVTVSHLRFGPDPIRSTHLVREAGFVACHQWGFLDRPVDVLGRAGTGATFLLNSPHPATDVWEHLPIEIQTEILDKQLDLWVVDADRVAADAGMGNRINTVMLPCFFALSGVLPRGEAIDAIKASITRSYGKRGDVIVEQNHAAVDASLDALQRVTLPDVPTGSIHRRPPVPDEAPDFVRRVTARMLAGEGDLLPVSALPVDGTFPTGTARWERRMIAAELPQWDPDICIDCGKCTISCPHTAIQMKVFEPADEAGAPDGFLSKPFRSRDLPDHRLSIQVAPDDCTGCGVCVDVCPVRSKEQANHKALNMAPAGTVREAERPRYEFFRSIPYLDRDALPHDTIKGSQVLEPLFEFSGACAGCGETPYLHLLTQLFGDRMVVANATGCSSIYGGNLPTTPWTTNADGRGPAWSNSLFEDNAEFGLGLRVGNEVHVAEARRLVEDLSHRIGADLAGSLLGAEQRTDAEIRTQRERVVELRERLADLDGDPTAHRLASLADELVRTSTWIVGGDGWAYDIGFGGLDHVLASGRDLNVLVLDTEVYSNTGGQASKATARGAVAKFAAAGKPIPKKDLGATGRQYGDVFVGQVALGASEQQTIRTLLEADAWPGPSLVIAYSTCIAHGIDMSTSISHMKGAVRSGYWPLYRFHPGLDEHDHPFQLDSRAPSIPLREFTEREARYEMLTRTRPERAGVLAELAQADVDERWRYYEQLADIERRVVHPDSDVDAGEEA